MSEQESKSPQRAIAEAATNRVNWIIDPKRGLLLPLTGIWILALDWLLFSSNVLTAGIATPVVVAIGFFVGGIGTLILQKRVAGDPYWKAMLKAIAAGVVVGVPWPLTGSLLGGWILLAAGLNKAKSETPKK